MSVSPCVSPNCKVNVVWKKVLNYIDLNIYYGDLQFGGKKQTAMLPDVDVVFLVKLYNILSALLLAAIHLF